MTATAVDRQAARDRAADAIAPHEAVVIGKSDWQPTPIVAPWATERERRRMSQSRRDARRVK